MPANFSNVIFTGFRYFNDFEVKIPRSEIEQIEGILIREISALDPDYIVTICGSYRY